MGLDEDYDTARTLCRSATGQDGTGPSRCRTVQSSYVVDATRPRCRHRCESTRPINLPKVAGRGCVIQCASTVHERRLVAQRPLGAVPPSLFFGPRSPCPLDASGICGS